MDKRTVINALSFDVEEWFHNTSLEKYIERSRWEACESTIERNVRALLFLLKEKGVFATFFTLGWIAERHPGLVREISGAGHEIATHGWSHTRAYQQTPEEFEAELRKSADLLEKITGQPVLGHRAACFAITPDTRWVIEALERGGFAYDSSIFPVAHDRYGMVGAPRFPYILRRNGARNLVEFPPSTWRFMGTNIPIAGGGYFRLYPYALTRFFIRDLNRRGHPAMVYLHPPEFDPDQPKVKMSPVDSFRVYVGIKSNFRKLERLLWDFKFAPVKEVLRMAGHF